MVVLLKPLTKILELKWIHSNYTFTSI